MFLTEDLSEEPAIRVWCNVWFWRGHEISNYFQNCFRQPKEIPEILETWYTGQFADIVGKTDFLWCAALCHTISRPFWNAGLWIRVLHTLSKVYLWRSASPPWQSARLPKNYVKLSFSSHLMLSRIPPPDALSQRMKSNQASAPISLSYLDFGTLRIVSIWYKQLMWSIRCKSSCFLQGSNLSVFGGLVRPSES